LFVPALLVVTFGHAAFAQQPQPLSGPPPQQDAQERARIEQEAAQELSPHWQSIRQDAYARVDQQREEEWRRRGYVYPQTPSSFGLGERGYTLTASLGGLVTSSGAAVTTQVSFGLPIYEWAGAYASVGMASERLYGTAFLSVPLQAGFRATYRRRGGEVAATLGANFSVPVENIRATYSLSIAPEIGGIINTCILRTTGESCLGLSMYFTAGVRIPTHSDSAMPEMMRVRAYATFGAGPTWMF
jgi:hypothetical protein